MLTSCAAIAVAALVAGCGDDRKDSASSQATKPVAYTVTATAEGLKTKALESPSTVKAGLVTVKLTNKSFSAALDCIIAQEMPVHEARKSCMLAHMIMGNRSPRP